MNKSSKGYEQTVVLTVAQQHRLGGKESPSVLSEGQMP